MSIKHMCLRICSVAVLTRWGLQTKEFGKQRHSRDIIFTRYHNCVECQVLYLKYPFVCC